MSGAASADNYIVFARVLALVHALIVAITVAGGVAIFTGRFRQFRLPWLPNWFAFMGVPLVTLGALAGAGVQIVGSVRRRRGEKS